MPLCPENSYGMDVGRELGEITGDCYLAARLGFIDDDTMERIHREGYRNQTDSFEAMIKGLVGVNQYLVDQINAADDPSRFALNFIGALDASYDLELMAARAASILIQGRILSMVRQGKLTAEELEAAQDRHFCSDTQRVLNHLGRGLRLTSDDESDQPDVPAVPDPIPEVFQDKDLYHPAMFNQALLHPKVQSSFLGLQRMDDCLQALAGSIDLRGLRRQLDLLQNTDQSGRSNQRLTASEKLLKKSRQSLGRKILRRSMIAFKQLIGAKELKAFLGEDGLTVQGHYFDYKLQKNSAINLVNNAYNPGSGHIPYNLTLLDKKTGLEMADLCVYFRDTPALDQVAAMLMHLQTGEEKAILSKANIFNIRPDFYRIMENIVTEVPVFNRQVQWQVNRHQAQENREEAISDVDSALGLGELLRGRRDSHPGHRIVNEHMHELRHRIQDHFRERLTLSPMFKGLMALGESGNRERFFTAMEAKDKPVRLEQFCREQMNLDWQPPALTDAATGHEPS